MKKRNTLIILFFMFILIFIFCFYFINQKDDRNIENTTFQGGYQDNALILSIDENNNKIYYYDQNNELSDISVFEGEFKKIDSETLIILNGELKDSIIIMTKAGIKLIYSFTGEIKVLNIKKIDNNVVQISQE